MHKGPDDLFSFLKSLGIETETVDHPPLHTVAESRALRGQIPGGHTKNLFVKDRKEKLFLLVAREDATIDLKRVHEAISGHGKVSFCSAPLLAEVLGVSPGSVTPFGVINDIGRRATVVLEERIMRFERLNFHPLVNTRTTGIGRSDLIKFLEAACHWPKILRFDASP